MGPAEEDVVVTGWNLLCSLGSEPESLWRRLAAGESGIRTIASFPPAELPSRIAGELQGWDPKEHVQPRKSLKVMSRDSQLAVASSLQAFHHSGLKRDSLDPDRMGVIYGADRVRLEFSDSQSPYEKSIENGVVTIEKWGGSGMFHLPPLAFLKTLPNMLPAHVSIVLDARGPNNTLHHDAPSGLLAVEEGARTLAAGRADMLLVGSAASRISAYDMTRAELYETLSRRNDAPAAACRPFDLHRDGAVRGEGAGSLVMERRKEASARGAKVWGVVRGAASAYRPPAGGEGVRKAIEQAVRMALKQAGWKAEEVGHVNAHGLSTPDEDRWESAALAALLPGAPVTAPKGNFGNLSAGAGVAELVVSLMAFAHDAVPPIANYTDPDPAAPICAVRGALLGGRPKTCICVNFNRWGQAAAVALSAE